MKNVIVCANCGTENPFYNFTCSNCKNYLRDRVYNIDLWKVISLLIESPTKAYRIIIHAEHKNFVFFIIILASAKFFIDSIFFSLLSYKNSFMLENILLNFFYIFIFQATILFLFSYLINHLNRLFGLLTRVKDNFSILTYSLLPHAFALFFVFPVEMVVFGGDLFSANPSPFVTKKNLAYALLAFEGLVILWSLFLSVSAMFTQSRNIIYSLCFGIIFQALIFLFLYFLPSFLR